MGRPSVRTVLLGSRVVFREGLGRILSTVGFDIVASASSVARLAAAELAPDLPTLVVLDVGIDQAFVVREAELLRDQYPAWHVAVLGDQHQLDQAHVIKAFRAGVHAYFESPNSGTFIKSLELVMCGEAIVPTHLVALMLHQHDQEEMLHTSERLKPAGASKSSPRLSEREICILRCLIAGHSNKTIARNKAIAEATVKVHVKAILRKIHVRNRTQAAIWAMHNGNLIAAGRDQSPEVTVNGTEAPATAGRAMFGDNGGVSQGITLFRP